MTTSHSTAEKARAKLVRELARPSAAARTQSVAKLHRDLAWAFGSLAQDPAPAASAPPHALPMVA